MKIRWGILGCGNIAHKFAEGLKSVEEAELTAVGSRTKQKADEFGEKYTVLHRHGSYRDLINDPDVDVIYVATPHSFHKENSIECLNGGKHVLCEKPFAVNASEVEEIIDAARNKKLFLMEAMWTRFLPSITKLRELLAEGIIGDVRMLTASLGFRAEWNPQRRLFNPELAGGALLDVGIYTVSFSHMVFGTQPSRIAGLAQIGKTGVDEQNGIIFGYDRGQLAILYSAVMTEMPHESMIMGTKGMIKLNEGWWYGCPITISLDGKESEEIDLPIKGNGYNYEAEEVCKCIKQGRLESTIMPLEESRQIIETMDRVRSQWNLKYPMEE